MQDIIDSFLNGQFVQMSKQIRKFGEKEFAFHLMGTYTLSSEQKVKLLCWYLTYKN